MKPESITFRYWVKLLCCLFFLQAAYFFNGSSWNQNARLDVIFSFVEPGPDQYSFRINRFIPKPEQNINTGDWSKYDGNYYSNKAPGVALYGIPMYFLLYHLEQLLNLDAATPKVALINSYLLNVWVSVLPATFGLFYFAFLVRRAGATERASVTLSFVLGFGTLYFPYSTQLWGHGSACAFLIMSVFFIVRQRSSDISLAAACMGFAVLMDFLAALPACLSLLLFHRTQRTEVMRYIVIGLAFAGVLLLYNRACFGAFFVMPTDHMNPAFVDHDGLMGMFRSFQGEALFGLTLSLRRGIFVMMPILIFSIYGFARGLLNRERDKLFWYALLVASSLLGVNVCFNGWHGGATVAARYQIIALPFWLLALARVNLQGFLFKVCTLISVANMLVIASFGVLCPDSHANPLYGAAYPFVVRALLHNHVSFGLPILPFGNLTPMPLPIRLQALDGSLPRYGNFTAWNWGELIGVSEGLSLALPIALVVVLLYRLVFSQESKLNS